MHYIIGIITAPALSCDGRIPCYLPLFSAIMEAAYANLCCSSEAIEQSRAMSFNMARLGMCHSAAQDLNVQLQNSPPATLFKMRIFITAALESRFQNRPCLIYKTLQTGQACFDINRRDRINTRVRCWLYITSRENRLVGQARQRVWVGPFGSPGPGGPFAPRPGEPFGSPGPGGPWSRSRIRGPRDVLLLAICPSSSRIGVNRRRRVTRCMTRCDDGTKEMHV
jgi:hypothetical protein